MILTLELSLILLGVLGLGVWAVVTGIRQSRQTPRTLVSPQVLSALAQPYKRYMGEAVAIHKDVTAQARHAPDALQYELKSLAERIGHLIERALPRAQHGTNLVAYLLELSPTEPQYEQTKQAATRVDTELNQFVEHLKTLRGKVYQVLTDATTLSEDSYLERDLQDALIEVEALEEAFSDVRTEVESLP